MPPRRRRPPGFGLKLSDVVREVADDYLRFLHQTRDLPTEADPRAFAARHAAAKAALAHIEALMKLAHAGAEDPHTVLTEQALQLGAVRAAIAKEAEIDDPDAEGDPG